MIPFDPEDLARIGPIPVVETWADFPALRKALHGRRAARKIMRRLGIRRPGP